MLYEISDNVYKIPHIGYKIIIYQRRYSFIPFNKMSYWVYQISLLVYQTSI